MSAELLFANDLDHKAEELASVRNFAERSSRIDGELWFSR
jgi:hypothetical protein